MISVKKTAGQFRKTFQSRHISNSLWNVADVAIYPIIMFCTIRMFMNHLGEEQYGIWQIVNTVIASLGVVNVGFGDATIRFVSRYRAEHNEKGVVGIISATLWAYIGIASVVAVGGFLAGVLAKYDLVQLFDITAKNRVVAISAFQLGCATFGLRLIEQIVLAALRGMERYDAASRLSIIGKLVLLGLNIYMVQMGYNIVQIFLNSLGITFITLILEFLYLKRAIPGMSFLPHHGRPYLKEVTPYGFWTWIQSVLHIGGSLLDKFLVTSLAGVKVFAYYSVAAMLAERIQGLLAAGAGFAFPIVARRTARDEPVLKMFNKLQFVMATAGLVTALAFFFLKDPILGGFVLKERYPGVNQYLPGFILYLFLTSLTIIPFYFLVGSGQARLATYLRGITLTCQVVYIPLIYHWQGPTYIPYALCLMVVTATPIHNWFIAKTVLQTAPSAFSLRQWAMPTLALLAVIAYQTGLPVYAPIILVALTLYAYYKNYFRPVAFVFK